MTAVEIVPANSAALAPLDPASREVAVTAYLAHARDQLAHAVEMSGPAAVAALKAEIATAAEATKQLGLSKEIQSDAQEMVRRAEYALGKAIRAGQERGEIRRQGESGGPRVTYERDGRVVNVDQGRQPIKISPSSFASKAELSGTDGTDGIYAMTDGISETQFDAAIGDAKVEGNLSRANVVRKLRNVAADGLTPVEKLTKIRALAPTGYSSGQIAKEIGTTEDYVRRVARENGIEITADKVLRGTRRTLDSNRIVQETVTSLEGIVISLRLINFGDLDRDQLEHWSASLAESLRALNRLQRQIKETNQ